MFITVKSKFQDHWPKYFKIIQSTCGMAQQTVVLFFHDMSLWKQEPSNALADSKTDSAITLSFSCILQTNAAKGSGIARCCSSQRSLGHPGLDSRLVAQRGPSAVRLSSWGPGGAPGFLGGMEAVGTGLKKNKNKKVCPVQKGIDSAFCFSWAASTVGIPAELKLDFEVIFFFFFAGRSPVSLVFPALPFSPKEASDTARCVHSAGLGGADPMSSSPDFPFK